MKVKVLRLFGLAALLVVISVPAKGPRDVAASTRQADSQVTADSALVVPNDNRIPAGQLRSGVLTLRLVARASLWRPEGPRGPELPILAFAEEGRAPRIPGPMIRVPVGTEVRATITNSLPGPLRFFGFQDRPSDALDTLELPPGESRELRFRAGAPGTYLYWGRTTRDTFPFGQLEDGQLSGAIVVDSLRGVTNRSPAARTRRRGGVRGGPPPGADRVFVIGLWKARETPPGTPVEQREETLVVNGLAWPHTERLTHTVGDTLHFRVINATRRAHPMHLHGFYYSVTARGTRVRDSIYSAAEQRLVVTERLAAGTTMSMTWSPHTAGNWLFHCHLVEHISGRVNPRARHAVSSAKGAHRNHALEGMSGLVLGIAVRLRPGGGGVGGDPVTRTTPPRRTLRLFATERPRVFGEASAYSFVLQDGAREPAADSLRVPGSPIVLTRGEPVAITVLNRGREAVAVHWHGIELESYFDGVGGWSGLGKRIAPPIAPLDSFVVRFTPPRAGTFIYHTHQNEVQQFGGGRFGPLLVLEPGVARDSVTDRILLMGSGGPFAGSPPSLNGETSPAPIELQAGTTYRLRFISIAAHDTKAVRLMADTTLQRWRAIAKDGADLPPHQATMRAARVLMGTGETWDFEYTPTAPRELTLEILTTGGGLPPVRTHMPVHVR